MKQTTLKTLSRLSNNYGTCDYCGTSQRLGDVLSCCKCGAPLKPPEVQPLKKLSKKVTWDEILQLEVIPKEQLAVMVLDSSHWNGVIDFDTWVITDALYQIIKASQGTYEDTQCQTSTQACLDREIGFGWYHFFDTTKDPISAANFLANQVNELAAAKAFARDSEDNTFLVTQYGKKFRVWLDCEWTTKPGGGSWTPAEMAARIKAFIDEFFDLTGLVLGIYTRVIWWNDNVARNNWAHLHPLWVARYNDYIDDPGAPEDWAVHGVSWTLWQYSADGNGMGSHYGYQSNSADLSRFHGYQHELIAWIDYEEPPVIEPPPTDCCEELANQLTQVKNDLTIAQDAINDHTAAIAELQSALEALETRFEEHTHDTNPPLSITAIVKPNERCPALSYTRTNAKGKPIIEVNVYQEFHDPANLWEGGNPLQIFPQFAEVDGSTKYYIVAEEVNKHGYPDLYVKASDLIITR